MAQELSQPDCFKTPIAFASNSLESISNNVTTVMKACVDPNYSTHIDNLHSAITQLKDADLEMAHFTNFAYNMTGLYNYGFTINEYGKFQNMAGFYATIAFLNKNYNTNLSYTVSDVLKMLKKDTTDAKNRDRLLGILKDISTKQIDQNKLIDMCVLANYTWRMFKVRTVKLMHDNASDDASKSAIITKFEAEKDFKTSPRVFIDKINKNAIDETIMKDIVQIKAVCIYLHFLGKSNKQTSVVNACTNVSPGSPLDQALDVCEKIFGPDTPHCKYMLDLQADMFYIKYGGFISRHRVLDSFSKGKITDKHAIVLMNCKDFGQAIAFALPLTARGKYKMPSKLSQKAAKHWEAALLESGMITRSKPEQEGGKVTVKGFGDRVVRMVGGRACVRIEGKDVSLNKLQKKNLLRGG